jgi:hypothetical protein
MKKLVTAIILSICALAASEVLAPPALALQPLCFDCYTVFIWTSSHDGFLDDVCLYGRDMGWIECYENVGGLGCIQVWNCDLF